MPKKARKKDEVTWREAIDIAAKEVKDVLDELREYDLREGSE